MSTIRTISAATFIVLCILPMLVFAQNDPAPAASSTSAQLNNTRTGIFSCSRTAATASSVGSTVAIGGVYVPVADGAGELNTGSLGDKECVLRELIDRMREAQMAGLAKKAIVAIQTGRDGNPQYVVNEGQERLKAMDKVFTGFVQGAAQQNINEAFRAEVTRAMVRDYETQTRAPESALRCPYQGNLRTAITAPTQEFSWEGLAALGDPACNPLGAYYIDRTLAENATAACAQYLQDQWDWGRGYYPMTTDPSSPCYGQIVTPAVNVQENFQTLLDSPVRQAESANDVGQMIGALYGGMTTQIISDNQGLAGLLQSVGGQPSYLNQLVNESRQGLRNAYINIALEALNSARLVEAAYFQAVNAMMTALTGTATQLRTAENQCWNLIIPKVCSSALSAQNTCTDGSGNTYKVATSTEAFAQPVITAQITPFIGPVTTKISTSQNALRLIDQLIQGVSNTASLDAQRLALIQLDSLISQGLLHTNPDVTGPTGVVKQLADMKSIMTALVTDTVTKWADDPSPSIGWCNINNPAVIQGWKDKWKQ